MDEKKTSGKVPAFMKVICILLVLCIGASTAFGVLNFVSQKKISAKLEAVNAYVQAQTEKDNDDGKRENDITICDEYVIKATTQISDAYKSGDTSSLSDRDKETLDMAEAVIDKYITDDMTDYDKEYAIYLYLTKEMTFDSGLLTVIPNTGADSDNPYGVLKYHTAVCVGYATTFRMFMQMFGINCMVCHNSDLTHTWDIVQLDGDWYHTDCYSDSDSANGANFNMNDELCSQNHDWDRDFFPAANGVKYGYFTRNVEQIEDIYAIPAFVSEKIEAGETSFSCSFKKKIEKDDEPAAELMINTILNYLNNCGDNWYSYIWTTGEDGNYVLCIYCQNNSDIVDYDVSDDVSEKVMDAVSEYFPDAGYMYDDGYVYDEYDTDDVVKG